jgi:hypothetical protein
MIILHCYDDKPCKPEEMKPGMLSPTHCSTVGKNGTIEYVYQAEQWVIDIGNDYPEVVRVECPALGRNWERKNGKMLEVTDESDA